MFGRIFVINLERSRQRRARLQRELADAGIPTERVDFVAAVDGLELTSDELARRGFALFEGWKLSASAVMYYRRDLKWGEVGCALSHREVWRRVAELPAPALVLEDDVALEPGTLDKLEAAIARLSHAVPDWDFCYVGRKRMGPPLGASTDEPERAVAEGVVVPTFSYSTMGYVLTPNGARRLLQARLERAIVPVDEFLPALYARHPRDDVRAIYGEGDRLRAFAVEPNLISHVSHVESLVETSPPVDSSEVARAAAARAGHTAREKSRCVLRALQGEPLHVLARELGVDSDVISAWKHAFVASGALAFADSKEEARDSPARAAPPPGLAAVLNGNPAAFLAEAWPRQWTVARGPVDRLALPRGMFDLERLVRAPGVRMSLFGKNGLRAAIASAMDAMSFYKNGDTIYMVGLEGAFPALSEHIHALARDLDVDPSAVHVEGFASPKGAGSSMHYDFDVNFNVQLVGTKQWRIAENPDVENPLQSLAVRDGVAPISPFDGRTLPREMPPSAESYVLDPGDAIFLPRGVWHETRVLSDSLAIAFVIKPPPYLNLFVNELTNRLRADPRWRAYPFGRDRTATLGELIGSLPAMLSTIQPEEVFFNVVRVRWADGVRATTTRLEASMDGDSVLLRIEGPNESLELPVADTLAPVVQWMITRADVFSTDAIAAACPGVSVALARKVVSYLVDVGVLVRAAASDAVSS